MKLNSSNFVSVSKEVVIELTLLLFSYQEIKEDKPGKSEAIKLLDSRFDEMLTTMHDVITFASKAMHTADLVTDNLKSALELTAATLKEKSRILKVTMAVEDNFNVSDYFSLN